MLSLNLILWHLERKIEMKNNVVMKDGKRISYKRKTEKSKVLITYDNIKFKEEKDSLVNLSNNSSNLNIVNPQEKPFIRKTTAHFPQQENIKKNFSPINLNLKLIDNVKRLDPFSESSVENGDINESSHFTNESELPPHQKALQEVSYSPLRDIPQNSEFSKEN